MYMNVKYIHLQNVYECKNDIQQCLEFEFQNILDHLEFGFQIC